MRFVSACDFGSDTWATLKANETLPIICTKGEESQFGIIGEDGVNFIVT